MFEECFSMIELNGLTEIYRKAGPSDLSDMDFAELSRILVEALKAVLYDPEEQMNVQPMH